MALVNIDGTPIFAYGHAGTEGRASFYNLGGSYRPVDAAGDSVMFIGQIFTEDGASHTIDTTGASSLGWMTGVVSTFADAGTTVKVGLAGVDTENGPPARAVNVSGTITFDVSASFTGGGGGITANSWQEHVPNIGSKTVANGDLLAFCVQMTARGGSDTVGVQINTAISAGQSLRPCTIIYESSNYSPTYTGPPNAVITFADGKKGFFVGGYPCRVQRTQGVWSNATSPNEYGNLITLPFAAKVFGFLVGYAGADAEFVLYSDPLGTPVAERTISIDASTMGGSSLQAGYNVFMFATPYIVKANQPLGAILKPTSATNMQAYYTTVADTSHFKGYASGRNSYAINRSAGAFVAQNSGKDRFTIGLLIGAVPHHARPSFSLGI